MYFVFKILIIFFTVIFSVYCLDNNVWVISVISAKNYVFFSYQPNNYPTKFANILSVYIIIKEYYIIGVEHVPERIEKFSIDKEIQPPRSSSLTVRSRYVLLVLG